MAASVDIDARIGQVRLSGDLNRVLVRGSLPFMRAIRNAVADEMDRTCPYDSGDLFRSQYVNLDERTGNIEAGATVDYADAVHDGHTTRAGTFVPPRPWIRHALLKHSHGRIGRA